MTLKQFQNDTLAALRGFLERARIAGPKGAYEALIADPELADRLGHYAGPYVPLRELPDVPYVCLRLPTGGGKTLLAARSVAVARDSWIERDYPLVLWLVPSNTIRRQTVEALKNSRHPYRQALDAAFGGRVRIFDIAEFTHIRPQDLRNQCCVVIGTIQTLRVSNTEGRKVYAHHEELEPHFSVLPQTTSRLATLAGGGIKFSFANLMHCWRPLMIVDEAHNAVTGLTREMQARVNPAAIIEFSATPRVRSNILYSVTAQELRREQMIKLPIMLSEHDNWQNAVNGAIAARASLVDAAKKDTDYLRPIVLFQAQPRGQEVTTEVLKEHLIGVEQIPEHKIAVATGVQRELDGIDLFDPQCAIEYVITIEALKEGWDCSFAYVFCSVSRIQSAVDVEQLLGRVLRMPYAARRHASELNRSYAYLSEPSFGHAARALVDKLVAMGFDEEEAHDSIEPMQRPLLDEEGHGHDWKATPEPTFRFTVAAGSETLLALEQRIGEGLRVRETSDGRIEIAATGPVDAGIERLICNSVPELERARITEAFATYRTEGTRELTPAERGETFRVPRMMTFVQGELAFADTDLFMEAHDWSLLTHPSRLEAEEFIIRETARSFEIDLDGNRITCEFAREQEQLALNISVREWTPEALVLWIDGQVRQPDIGQAELIRWLSELVGHLTGPRGLHISALMRCKFLLARKIRSKIDDFRQQERRLAYQRYLFAPAAKPTVSFDSAFVFREGIYRDERRYRGHWQPAKHFLGRHFVPAFDGASDGEEFQCAQVIDSLPEVRFWLRNVARHPESFWLPTASGRFYPDFVAKLEDDRLLVVEYKGAHIADSFDTVEKRTVGELWQRKSKGAGIFVVVEKSVAGRGMRQQLIDCLG